MPSRLYPSLSVIMPVRNEQNHLENSILSILEQNYPGELEIVLALAPSLDETSEIASRLAREHKIIQLVPNPKGLTTSGLNLAISKARGAVIARVDAHSQVGPNYFSRGVELLQEHGAVLVGGLMKAQGGSPVQSAVAAGYRSRIGIGGGSYHIGGAAREAESVYLGIFDAIALKNVSGYDENVIRGEDWDLAQRLKSQGGKVWFSPELEVSYWPRSNIKALAWQFYTTGVWRGQLTRWDIRRASPRYFVPPLFLLSVIGLGVASGFGGTIFWVFSAPIFLYLLVLLFASISAKNINLFGRLAIYIVFPVMHLSWAFGFWQGFLFGAKETIDSGDKR